MIICPECRKLVEEIVSLPTLGGIKNRRKACPPCVIRIKLLRKTKKLEAENGITKRNT